MSGIQYMNARRDLILGIGQSKALPVDLARVVFFNDWVICAIGFFFYATVAFGLLWFLLARYPPLQDAVLDPFGVSTDAVDEISTTRFGLERRRRGLCRITTAGVIALFVALAITLVIDATVGKSARPRQQGVAATLQPRNDDCPLAGSVLPLPPAPAAARAVVFGDVLYRPEARVECSEVDIQRAYRSTRVVAPRVKPSMK
jgi:hypothetical protein